MSSARPFGPAPSADLLKVTEVAREYRRSADRLRRHLADGSLHRHRVTDRPGGRWDIPRAVVVAWFSGLGPADQRRACPLCASAPLHAVPSPRRRTP